jgi:hypothetical protein
MSTVKVNTVDKRTGSTLTLGGCGTTVTLACGATQSGFGRTGTVDWCTTAKTAPFTGVSGKGYFVNTTCGAVTVTLPASPSAGDIVSLKDYNSTWQTNNVTLGANGSKINGTTNDAVLDTEAQSVTLIYVDATKGWKSIQDSTADITGGLFIQATGGTVTTCGNYKIHTFTSSGCFSVSCAGNPAGGGSLVSYMVVAGGAGSSPTGGGGAGGFREGKVTSGNGADSYTASPIVAADGISISATTYPITVGGGGAKATPGSNSIFSSITSTGGGTGGGTPYATPTNYGAPGGSGGGGLQGASAGPTRPALGGTGNTPPTSPSQGFPGGYGMDIDNTGGGGGGGATSQGGDVATTGVPGGNTGIAGPGGNGAGTAINSSPTVGTPGPSAPLRYYAGGGGGSQYSPGAPTSPALGGYGGGGDGVIWTGSSELSGGTAGTTNTGGAGGAKVLCGGGTTGGSGIVIIRYKYQ